ncbi:MAG TPA: thymidylate kinase [Acidobacteriaceae bacterium]|jgi:thymidylate kinase|nr:thymidylate kinase [Acidobacteriaceae bacterium]
MVSRSTTQPTLVSFSGIDGAGKSTQIDALRSLMVEAGLQVRVIPFWDEVARLKNLREASGHKIFKGEKGVGSPERPIERRDKNVRSRTMSLVRLFLYTVDSLSLRFVVRRALRSGAGFLICDRYAYDEFVNLNLRNPFMRMYVRLMMRLIPRPDVSYILDADPIQARARKPEYPLEFLYSCRESYLTLSQLIGGMTIVPPNPVPEVHRQIVSALASTAAARKAVRATNPPLEDPESSPAAL